MALKDLIPELENLKAEAKLARDDRDYREAIRKLNEAISLADRSGWDSAGTKLDDTGRKIAWHVSDCWGMIGGNYRRMKDLPAAIECFSKGRTYEQDERYGMEGSGYGIASSYNAVNAIVSPIEALLRDATSQTQALQAAVKTLEQQTLDPKYGVRRTDRWAWADLGQCKLLLGEVAGAETAYNQFLRLSDPASIRSSREVLDGLHDALQKMDDPRAATVRMGLDFLEAELERRR